VDGGGGGGAVESCDRPDCDSGKCLPALTHLLWFS
jgi:hypothetical protein